MIRYLFITTLILSFSQTNLLAQDQEITLSGKVYDSYEKVIIDQEIIIRIWDSKGNIEEGITDPVTGDFFITGYFKPGKEYIIECYSEVYKNYQKPIIIPENGNLRGIYLTRRTHNILQFHVQDISQNSIDSVETIYNNKSYFSGKNGIIKIPVSQQDAQEGRRLIFDFYKKGYQTVSKYDIVFYKDRGKYNAIFLTQPPPKSNNREIKREKKQYDINSNPPKVSYSDFKDTVCTAPCTLELDVAISNVKEARIDVINLKKPNHKIVSYVPKSGTTPIDFKRKGDYSVHLYLEGLDGNIYPFRTQFSDVHINRRKLEPTKKNLLFFGGGSLMATAGVAKIFELKHYNRHQDFLNSNRHQDYLIANTLNKVKLVSFWTGSILSITALTWNYFDNSKLKKISIKSYSSEEALALSFNF